MLCKPTGPLYRIGRADSPFHFSEISPDVSELPQAGNRFDVLGGGVLYAASTPTGAFVETLQSFRPTTAARAAVARDAPGLMIAGSVPRDWRERRRLARLTLEEPSPFIDVESSDAWPVLEDALALELSLLGVSHIDVSIVRGSNRLVTRLLARWAYLASSASGEPAYGGVRYNVEARSLRVLGHLRRRSVEPCWSDPDYQAGRRLSGGLCSARVGSALSGMRQGRSVRAARSACGCGGSGCDCYAGGRTRSSL